MRRSTRGRHLAVLVVLASLTRGTLAAFGTSKPPDVTYATGAAATTSNVPQTVIDGAQTAINQAQSAVNSTTALLNQTQGVLDHVENTVNQLEQAVCQNGVCRFPNGSIFDQVLATTLPPRPTTTQRPTRAPTKAGAKPPTGTAPPPVTPPATPPVVVTPAPSPTPAPSQSTVVVPIDGSKEIPGGNKGAPQPGMPPGVPVGAFAQKPPKEEFDYMPLVWAAVALWSFIVLAIGSALFVQRGGGRARSESEGQPQV